MFCIVGIFLYLPAFNIFIYVTFDSFFFVLRDVSDSAFVPGFIMDSFVDWMFV